MFQTLLVTFLLTGIQALAAIQTEAVAYKDGSANLEGFIAYDDATKGKAPAVIIVHEWMGLEDFSKQKAREMAELGYIAFAADVYGKGIRPKDAKEAAEMAGKYKGDRNLMRSRAKAAYEALRKNPKVDPNRIVAMGYCFGGTTVLEMALAGLPLKGIVSFHGGLEFPKTLVDAKNIKTKLLILHGAVDPYVPADQVNSFLKALNDNKVDYQFVAYSGAVHSFTNPKAGDDPSKGAAYNAVADRRSTVAMKTFFEEVLR